MSEEIKEILKILKKCEYGACITKHNSRILLDYIKDLQQKVEQLENIRKEAIEYIEKCGGMELVNDYSFPEKPIIDKEAKTNLLNILNKGNNKEK